MRTLAAAVLVLAIAALGLYAFRQQQAANREILSRLDDVRSAAPPAPIELERKLTDPAFMKKMYYSFAALQAADFR